MEKIKLGEGHGAIGCKAKFLSPDKIENEKDKRELTLLIRLYGDGDFVIKSFYEINSSGLYRVFMEDSSSRTIMAKSNMLKQA